jgi:hypothetical protein
MTESNFHVFQRVTHQHGNQKEYGVIVHQVWSKEFNCWHSYVCFFGTAGFPERGEYLPYGQGVYTLRINEKELSPYEDPTQLPPPCL